MKIWLKTITFKQLIEIQIDDWIEGYGDILSLAEVTFIRKYGNLLVKLQDNPEWDATDAAHPAWWRGEAYSAWEAARLIAKVLSGEDTGKGAMNPVPGKMRDSVLALKQERDRLFKRCEGEENKLLSKLTKEYEAARSLWINAQKACKKHALRGDALEKERDKLQYELDVMKVGLDGAWERIHNLEEENGVYSDRIEELKKERDELQNEIVTMRYYWKDLLDIVKERNELKETCAKAIKETIAAEYKVRNLNEEAKLLEAENKNCWERIHDLEAENGKYWEMICKLEQQIESYLVQDTDPKKILEAMISLSKPKHKPKLDGDGLNEFLDAMAKIYNWVQNKIWRKK